MDTYRVHYKQRNPYGDVSWNTLIVHQTSRELALRAAFEVIQSGYDNQGPGWKLMEFQEVELHYQGEWTETRPHPAMQEGNQKNEVSQR